MSVHMSVDIVLIEFDGNFIVRANNDKCLVLLVVISKSTLAVRPHFSPSVMHPAKIASQSLLLPQDLQAVGIHIGLGPRWTYLGVRYVLHLGLGGAPDVAGADV